MLKKLLPLAFVPAFFFNSCKDSQKEPANTLKPEVISLWDHYDRYQEPVIKNRFFKHSDIVPLIEKHTATGWFQHEILGNSVQGRSIHHLAIGQGKTTVLLWSQMHGDESTATMALFDIFNFFTAKDEHDAFRKHLLERLSLHFVPMLNPDGAEVWQRRNALDIDINRDARAQATPEGRILTAIAKRINPMFGFNLHDQSIYYTAGSTRHAASISFLAPAYNYEKTMNNVRKRATQLIVTMNDALQTKIPGNIAKYDDEHDPRCFGDSFQGWGTSTILIESGGYPNDTEKQYLRKVNFYAILTALESIASENYVGKDIKAYDTIPENTRFLYDLVVRNVSIVKAGQTFTANLGINRLQRKNPDYRSIYFHGMIEEVGDMDRHFGYDEGDAQGLQFTAGKVKAMRKKDWDALTPADEYGLLREGFLFVKLTDTKPDSGPVANRVLNLIEANEAPKIYAAPGQSANFLLMRDDSVVYAVVNGFWIDLAQPAKTLGNTLSIQ